VAFKPYHFPERFALDAEDVSRVRDRALARIDEQWRVVEAHLFSGPGPYLQERDITVADLYLAMLLTWHPRARQRVAEWPNVARCFDAVTAEPIVARVMHAGGSLPLG
jgi:glutathione S-transferase